MNVYHWIVMIVQSADRLAYIDPSTGGMLFQILAAAFALFSGFIFFFSRQIKAFFARLRRKMRREPQPLQPESEEDTRQE